MRRHISVGALFVTAIVALGGATVTVVTTGGGGAVTVMAEVPVFPEHVAVIVAEPAAIPVTTPLAFTVAAAVLLDVHVMVCPVITLPCASFTVAESATVAPAAIVALGGDTVTVVTTGATAVTVMAEVPDLPELVAVIVAEPAATPATTPLAFTVAAAVLLDVHVIVCPVITLPCASLTVAVRATVEPAATEAEVGAMVTVVTTGGGGGAAVTVTVAVPDLPETLAVIVAVPAAIPETTPAELTVVTFASLVDQVKVRPEITLPLASFAVA